MNQYNPEQFNPDFIIRGASHDKDVGCEHCNALLRDFDDNFSRYRENDKYMKVDTLPEDILILVNRGFLVLFN